MIKGCTFDNQNVTSRNDGGLYKTVFKDGVLWGCGMSFTSTDLTIQTGQMSIGGRIIWLDGATTIAAIDPILNGYGRLVLTIDLSKTATIETFEQIELEFVYSTTTIFPELTQDEINNTGSIYQAEIAVVSLENGNITRIINSIGPSIIRSVDFLNTGEMIAENTDLNTLKTPGVYRSETSTKSATLTNCPYTGGGFKLIVEQVGSSIQFRQRLIANNVIPKTFERTDPATGTWGEWHQVVNESGATINNSFKLSHENIDMVNIGSEASGYPEIIISCKTGQGTIGRIDFFGEHSGSYRTALVPLENGQTYLGFNGYRYNTAFFTNAITASDAKEKANVESISKAKDFILNLRPVEYNRVGPGDSGERKHMGFIAQEVSALAKEINMGNMAIYQASIINEDGTESPYEEGTPDEKLSWGLNYTEFIAPLVATVQAQQEEIEALKAEVEEMRGNA